MAKKLASRDSEGHCEGGGVTSHILNCGNTATNTCIIMLRLSLAKPGNLASILIIHSSIFGAIQVLPNADGGLWGGVSYFRVNSVTKV